MVSAICLDLDGTLLNDDKIISEKTMETLKRAYLKGVKIIIATGRQYSVAKEMLSCLEFPLFIIYSNGAGVRLSTSDQRFFYHYLQAPLYADVMKLAKDLPLGIMINVDCFKTGPDMFWFAGEYDRYIEAYARSNSIRAKLLNDLSILPDKALSLVFIGLISDLLLLEDKVQRNNLKCNFHTMKNSGTMSLFEMMHFNGEKGRALRRLAKYLGFDMRNIVSFGDDTNDIGLLNDSGFSFAMKNGIEEVKSISNQITDKDNNHDGVAVELNRLLSLGMEF